MKFFATSLILFSTLVSIRADPQILNLREYLNGTIATVNNVEDGASLYVASNDSPDSLNNIQITTGGNTYRLSDLAAVNPDGKPNKVVINGGLTITTTNPNTVTYALSGCIYITTAAQTNDPAFQVFVITGSHHVDLTGFSTTVVLNTQLKVQTDDADQPQKSTYVQNLVVPDTHISVAFQWGIPAANWKQITNNQFFMNPFSFKTVDNSGNVVNQAYLFDHVEPLQVSLDYWYITSNGSITMDMQNNFVSDHVSTATAVTTTGILVNNNYLFEQHTVNLLSDPTRSRTVGTLLSAYPSSNAVVNFVFNGTDGSFVQTVDNKLNATGEIQTTQLSTSTFTITSTDITAGIFYCQYFALNGALLATTASTAAPSTGNTQNTQTTVNVQGTTGSTVVAGSTLSTVPTVPGTTGSTVVAGSTLSTGSTVNVPGTTGSTVVVGSTGSSAATVTAVPSVSSTMKTTAATTVSAGTGSTNQGTTVSPGTGSTSLISTTTIATTTSSVRSLSVLSSVIISILML
ncbi:hypothetical protein CAEBREN_01203 [Caenorhabditis brenneri]|uniref:Uncharacterized protein n=1 Tax=Caenorhabditis brenneri TaxID=135651 RepID=G0N6I8_CAEBE|nr:hypothetical protein CAEBREN_01203 [Caenorhabditis brenneri]